MDEIQTEAPLSSSLAEAIARHKSALALIDAHYGPEDLSEEIVDAEAGALNAVTWFPCSNDAEFILKLRYPLANHRSDYLSREGWLSSNAREILLALEQYFGGKEDGEGDPLAPRATVQALKGVVGEGS